MSYLKKISSGAVTERLDPNTELYQKLILQRDVNSRPVWEEISEIDVNTVTARVAVALVDALTLLQDDTFQLDTGPLEEAGTITSAEYTPNGSVTGVNTNTRSLLVAGAGGGTTHATLALVAGTNLVSGTAASFAVNSAAVAAGEELIVSSTHAGTGLADPGGIVTVEFTRTV